MVRTLSFALVAAACFASPAFLASQDKSKDKSKENPSSKAFKLTDAEKEILDRTNAARKEQSLPPLIASQKLTECARAHSANMAKQKKMAHDLDDKTPFDRIKAIGYVYQKAGENVAFGSGPVPIEQIFQNWMNSEGHRRNILTPDFTEIGIGVGTNEDEKYYTQVFGRPFPK